MWLLSKARGRVRMRASLTIITMLICGMMLGYELGVFQTVLLSIEHLFHVSSRSMPLVSASLSLAAAVSAFIAGFMTDRWGRRPMLFFVVVLFAFGILQCADAEFLSEFVLGRILLGFGVGIGMVLIPLYLVEIAPAKHRGQWMALFSVAINMGIFLGCLIGGTFSYLEAWRTVLLVSVVPMLLLAVLCFFIPESPRWLIFQGKQGQASQALIKLFGSRQAMQIISAMDAVHHRTIYQPIKLASLQGLRILLLGMLINIFAQAVGIHAVVTYVTVILKEAGWRSGPVDLISYLVISFVFILASILATRVIDQLPRRKLLLLGLTGIICSLVIMTWAFHNEHEPSLLLVMVLFGCLFFIGCQGFSVGPIASLLPIEIFPQSLRGAGYGIAVSAGWATNTIIVYGFPRMLIEYGPNVSFITFLFFSLLAWIWSYFNIPETRGVPLERLETNLLEGVENRDLGHIETRELVF